MDEFSRAACAHVDLNWDALKRVRLGCLKIEVVLSTNFIPLVSLDSRNFCSTNISTVRHPVRCEDTAAVIRRAAIAALISLGIVQVSVSILDILVARLISQVMGQSTVSVIDTVGTINTIHQV